MFMFRNTRKGPNIRQTHGVHMFPGPIPELLGAFMGGVPAGMGVHINIQEPEDLLRSMRVQGCSQFDNKRKQAAQILGVDEKANNDEVEKAYKDGCRKWHPDKHPENKKQLARQKFEEIGKARDVMRASSNETRVQNSHTKRESTNQDIAEETVFTNFANHIFEDFMRSSTTPTEDDLDVEADELFEFLRGMSKPPVSGQKPPNIFSFGPSQDQQSSSEDKNEVDTKQKESLNLRARIDIKDIWMNATKNLPIKNSYLLLLPLYYKDISYESKSSTSRWEEISVRVIDKSNTTYRRRGDSYDLETILPITIKDLYRDHRLVIKMLSGEDIYVRWKKEYMNLLDTTVEKGFYLYDLGFPQPDGTRGKLWVRFALRLTDQASQDEEPPKDKVCEKEIDPEIATAEEWWQIADDTRERSIILDLDAYLKKKKDR